MIIDVGKCDVNKVCVSRLKRWTQTWIQNSIQIAVRYKHIVGTCYPILWVDVSKTRGTFWSLRGLACLQEAFPGDGMADASCSSFLVILNIISESSTCILFLKVNSRFLIYFEISTPVYFKKTYQFCLQEI